MSIIISLKKITLMGISIGLLIVSACSSSPKKESNTKAETAILVKVVFPSSDRTEELTISGQVESAQSANISTRIMGYISKLNVNVGDHVNKGQVLATISNQDLLAKRAQTDAMIAEAEAGFKSAQKDYERFNNLYKEQSATAKELDNTTLQFSSAKSRLEAAKQMRNEVNASLGYTRLIAPFAGIVSQKLADAGSMANPGMPILTIEQNGSYQVTASVPENAISQVSQGSEAIITIAALNRIIRGKVTQISQSSQFTGGQYQIKMQIPDKEKKGLFSGMYANITIPLKKATESRAVDDRVMIPLSAIEYKNQLTGLYTIGNHNKALLRWVRLGKTEGDQVEVLSGLAQNEQFIVSADGKLFNGALVKIK